MNSIAWLAISCVALITTSVVSILISGLDLSNALNKLTQPVATLIAGIVGLGAIAYQTNRGFKNLISSQEHKANLERDARVHLHQLSADERAENDKIKSIRLVSAIKGELEGLVLRYLEISEMLARSEQLHRERCEQGVPLIPQSLELKRLDTPVIDASISDLYLIDDRIVRDISLLYAKIQYGISVKGISTYHSYARVYADVSAFYRTISQECENLVTVLDLFVKNGAYIGPIAVNFRTPRMTEE